MQQPFTDYYLILLNGTQIGVIRVVRRSDDVCRIAGLRFTGVSGKRLCAAGDAASRTLYPHTTVWQLDTILQEEKLCYLYEKLGYRKTGETETIQPGMDIVFYERVNNPSCVKND